MLENKLILGLDIDLTTYGLGIIKQPTIQQLVNLPFDDYSTPFILIEELYKNIDTDNKPPKLYLLNNLELIMLEQNKKKREEDIKFKFYDPFIQKKKYFGFFDRFFSILLMLYDCEESDLEITSNPVDDSMVIHIKSKAVIDKDNFEVLLKVIFKIFCVDIKAILNHKPDEWVEKTGSASEKQLIEKFKKKDEERQKKNTLHLCDYINYVVLRDNKDYKDILDWTYFQLLNSYRGGSAIDQESFYRDIFTSMQTKMESREIPSWRKDIKIQIDESIY